MTQISRLRTAEIANGNLVNADDIGAELNQLVNESNAQDTRITTVETGNATLTGNNAMSGNNTFSGTNMFSSHVNIGRAGDQGTPAEGDFWVNLTTHLMKFYNGTTTLVLATVADLLVAVPLQTSNAGKVLTTNGTVTSWATPIFSAYNLSSNVTITAAGAWTVTHGLGMAPKGIQLWLKCLSTELNYAVGDMVPVSSDNAHGTNDQGANAAVLSGNTTTINGRFGATASSFSIGDKTTGQNIGITNSKWALVVASWA